MANGFAAAGGSGGAVILRAEGLPGNHVVAKLGSKRVEGVIPEGGALQLKLPGLGLWTVDTETQDTSYHFEQEVKVYRYGITPCWAIAKKTFAGCTPEEIQFVAKSNLCRDFWQIGDLHELTMLDDTSEKIYLQIYGFDHDYAENGETKLPLTLGMKSVFSEPYSMNPTDTNVGGWTKSAFRTVILPSLFEKFPKEWRDIMTPCQKKTSAGDNSASIVMSTDRLFLFSGVEVSGLANSSYAGEGEVYPIFSDDASRLKYRNGERSDWWLRSPSKGYTTDFCYVAGSSGGIGINYAKQLRGASFGFCVG